MKNKKLCKMRRQWLAWNQTGYFCYLYLSEIQEKTKKKKPIENLITNLADTGQNKNKQKTKLKKP